MNLSFSWTFATRFPICSFFFLIRPFQVFFWCECRCSKVLSFCLSWSTSVVSPVEAVSAAAVEVDLATSTFVFDFRILSTSTFVFDFRIVTIIRDTFRPSLLTMETGWSSWIVTILSVVLAMTPDEPWYIPFQILTTCPTFILSPCPTSILSSSPEVIVIVAVVDFAVDHDNILAPNRADLLVNTILDKEEEDTNDHERPTTKTKRGPWETDNEDETGAETRCLIRTASQRPVLDRTRQCLTTFWVEEDT